MDTDFSASASGKTAIKASSGSTPFDKIAALEIHENARTQKEISAMEEEKREVEIALREKEEIGDQEIRDAARKELKAYRESELSTIVKDAEKAAGKETKALEESYLSREEAVVQRLQKKILNKDLSLIQG